MPIHLFLRSYLAKLNMPHKEISLEALSEKGKYIFYFFIFLSLAVSIAVLILNNLIIFYFIKTFLNIKLD